MTKRNLLTWLSLGSFAVSGIAQDPGTLFSDNFDADTSGNWTVITGSDFDPHDYTVDFAFDYSIHGIPPAPSATEGTTRGVKISVNNQDDTESDERVGVNLYPTGQSFSGNYALRFDMWINYNGGAFGGTGSTEYGLFGINHSGTQVNWLPFLDFADGIWFATTGEAGAALDYRAFEADDLGSLELAGELGGLVGTGHEAPIFQFYFKPPTFETTGAVGKSWVKVEVRQVDGILTWTMNGLVIASRANFSPFVSGNVMLGYMDIFNSIASPAEDNYVLFDNIRVVDLNVAPPAPEVTIEVIDGEASEFNDDASLRLIRTGDTSQALEVKVLLGGTATEGEDYTALGFTDTITIPAGASTFDIIVQPINDNIGEEDETIALTLLLSDDYEVGRGYTGVIDLLDDGDLPNIAVAIADGYMYERISEDRATAVITRLGSTFDNLEVQIQLGGSATSGSDFTSDITTTVTLFAGETEAFIDFTPLDDQEIEGDETIEITVLPNAGYSLAEQSTGTIIIRDNDIEEGTILFQDSFNQDSSGNYTIQFGSANDIEDYTATFAYDYGLDGIPSAPNSKDGSTQGVFLQVNKLEGTAGGAAGVNIFPTGQTFSGNYAIRFDMLLSVGTDVGGTTEHAIFGLNHSGNQVIRHSDVNGDGVWFAVNTDGSNNRAYARYIQVKDPEPQQDILNRLASDYAEFFSRPPFFSPAEAGAPSSDILSENKIWVDVELRQLNGKIQWYMNQNLIMEVEGQASSGNLMLGMNDQFNSVGSLNTFVLYDNLRVVALEGGPVEAPVVQITDISLVEGNQWAITFTANHSSGASYEASQFGLQTTEAFPANWSNTESAPIQGNGNEFTVQVPQTSLSSLYFRILFLNN